VYLRKFKGKEREVEEVDHAANSIAFKMKILSWCTSEIMVSPPLFVYLTSLLLSLIFHPE
jgi:hypothetical protein